MELGFTFINEVNICIPKDKNKIWRDGEHLKKLMRKPRIKKVKPIKKIKIKRNGTDKITCKICGSIIQRRIKAQHQRSFKCLNYNK